MSMTRAGVSQLLREQHNIEAHPGAKVDCPFCQHKTLSVHRDDSLAKCFHSACGRFITTAGSGGAETISLASIMADLYHECHQALLDLKDAPYQNAYGYLVQERKIHPRVVEDAMLGAIPSGGYDVDRAFQPLLDSLASKPELPKSRGRPKKMAMPAQTPEERLKWLLDIREKLRTCLLKHAGWLAFFYTDANHRIVAIRFRQPYDKHFVFFKPYKTVTGLFGHALFTPYELNGLQAYNEHLLVMEGELNPLQLQSLLVRRADAAGKDPGYLFACAVGGVGNTDWPMIQRLVKVPILMHDHDDSGQRWVEDGRQVMSVEATTTPLPSKDLDEYIRSFQDRDTEAWEAVKSIVKSRQPLYRLYVGDGSEFFSEHGFIPKRLGDAMMERHHLKYAAECLWVYREGVYHPDGERVVKREAHALLGEQIKEGHIQETLRYLEVETYAPPPEMSPEVINLMNGRFVWRTRTMIPHTHEVFDIVQFPFAYDPDATCPYYDTYCQTTFDDQKVVQLIDEVTGHLCVADMCFEKTIMALGPGSNGKGVWLDTLTALLGQDHVSHVALQDLAENRFKTAQLLGKLANIFADLDDKSLESSTPFKMLTTGDAMDAERKHEHPFTFRNYARMVYSANRMPRSRDKSYAYYRRWIIIPFEKTFATTEGDGKLQKDDELRSKLARELPGIFNRALGGLDRLYANRDFTIPKSVAEALATYQGENDTVAAFAKECLTESQHTGYIEKKGLYTSYRRWCAQQGFRKSSPQAEIKRTLTRLFPNLQEVRLDRGSGPWAWQGITFTEHAPSASDEADNDATLMQG
jgi:putative DNA primase/helicase